MPLKAHRSRLKPLFGTMAHSYVQAHDDELDAFEHFARTFPDGAVLLIDTYDTLAAAEAVVDLAQRLASEGIRSAGVRLDSGNMATLPNQVRQILDDGGCGDITILVSGSLDEEKLARDFAGLPIEGFGIGTRLDVSADAPSLDCAYKLEEYAGKPRRKCSAGKATLPGRKQVFRMASSEPIGSINRLFRQTGGYQEAWTRDRFALNPPNQSQYRSQCIGNGIGVTRFTSAPWARGSSRLMSKVAPVMVVPARGHAVSRRVYRAAAARRNLLESRPQAFSPGGRACSSVG